MGNPLDSYYIRAATEEDLPHILEIFNERIANSTCIFLFNQVPIDNRITWYNENKAKGFPIIVAIDKATNKTIAYCSLGTFRAYAAYNVSAEISLYIHQEHQRRGLGSVLLEEIIRIAKRMKLSSIVASITSENTGSIQLFSKFGFTNAGIFHNVGYKFGKYLDVTFMEYMTGAKLEGDVIPEFDRFPWDSYTYNSEI